MSGTCGLRHQHVIKCLRHDFALSYKLGNDDPDPGCRILLKPRAHPACHAGRFLACIRENRANGTSVLVCELDPANRTTGLDQCTQQLMLARSQIIETDQDKLVRDGQCPLLHTLLQSLGKTCTRQPALFRAAGIKS